jgi:uncharacterized membrane protein
MSALHAPADAPLILHLAAGALLATHIGGATVGMASGVVSIAARKGSRVHRVAGNVFFVAMLAMTIVATGVAPFIKTSAVWISWVNAGVGLFTFYLVATAWATVKRRPGQIGRTEAALVAAPLGVIGLSALMATMTWGDPKATEYAPLYIFAAVAAIAVACDLGVIRKGGVVGAQRIARHLWRMSLALAIALGSFAGQPKAVPREIQGPWMIIPMLIVLVLMFYWLVRYNFPKLFRRRAAPAAVSLAGAAS